MEIFSEDAAIQLSSYRNYIHGEQTDIGRYKKLTDRQHEKLTDRQT
jgi:hypothetical protein